MPIYKKVNVNFFKKWSSEMAYVLGFFMADGSIDINPRGSHYLNIQICDKELLESIRKVLESEHKIARIKGIGNERDRYRLQIGRKEMFNDLVKLGVNQRKAYTMKMPNVSKKYFGDFVRGYFDGDGNVWSGLVHKDRKNPKMSLQIGFTSCSGLFLKNLQKRLTVYGLGKGSLFPQKNCFRLKYSLNDSLILSKIMYNGSGNNLFLERKKIIFENFKNLRV